MSDAKLVEGMSQGRGEAQQGDPVDDAVVEDHGALQGGERCGLHEDPDQRESQPVEADQSQVFGFVQDVQGTVFSSCFRKFLAQDCVNGKTDAKTKTKTRQRQRQRQRQLTGQDCADGRGAS